MDKGNIVLSVILTVIIIYVIITKIYGINNMENFINLDECKEVLKNKYEREFNEKIIQLDEEHQKDKILRIKDLDLQYGQDKQKHINLYNQELKQIENDLNKHLQHNKQILRRETSDKINLIENTCNVNLKVNQEEKNLTQVGKDNLLENYSNNDKDFLLSLKNQIDERIKSNNNGGITDIEFLEIIKNKIIKQL